MTSRRHRRRRAKLFPRIQSVVTAPVISKKVSTSSQTDVLNMELVTSQQLSRRPSKIPQLESVHRITSLPIVEMGWNYAENIYKKIKTSNNLVYWTLGQAENSFYSVVDATLPAIFLFEGPINQIDKMVCKSLDIVEQKVPSINLPPEMIYWNTKQYVTDVSTKIVRPVLKRADSVKQIGNTVLASKYTAFAADTLDGALNVADKYVDKYLPVADGEQIDVVNNKAADGPAGKAINTFHHVDRFSRKLQRRLTQRTMAEMKALKKQSAEAVHVLVYVAEMIATDPVMAFQKGKELWASLSKDEPENQARPENLEQLIVLLTRESARRLVHLINFTSSLISKVPRNISHSVMNIVSKFLNVTDSMVKTVHMEKVQQTMVDILKIQARNIAIILKNLNVQITDYLDQVAENLKTPEPQKSALVVPKIKVQLRAEHINSNQRYRSNGVDSNNSS